MLRGARQAQAAAAAAATRLTTRTELAPAISRAPRAFSLARSQARDFRALSGPQRSQAPRPPSVDAQVANIPWLQRKAVAARYGALPESTFDEALGHLRDAAARCPQPWKDCTYQIARTLLKLERREEAAEVRARGARSRLRALWPPPPRLARAQ